MKIRYKILHGTHQIFWLMWLEATIPKENPFLEVFSFFHDRSWKSLKFVRAALEVQELHHKNVSALRCELDWFNVLNKSKIKLTSIETEFSWKLCHHSPKAVLGLLCKTSRIRSLVMSQTDILTDKQTDMVDRRPNHRNKPVWWKCWISQGASKKSTIFIENSSKTGWTPSPRMFRLLLYFF